MKKLMVWTLTLLFMLTLVLTACGTQENIDLDEAEDTVIETEKTVEETTESEPVVSEEETFVIEETEETSGIQETVAPVSKYEVQEMVNMLAFWLGNSSFESEPIVLNFDSACEIASIASAFGPYGTNMNGTEWTEDNAYYKVTVSDMDVDDSLHTLFGSKYNSASYNRTEPSSTMTESYTSVPTKYVIRDEDGLITLYNDGQWFDQFNDGQPTVVEVLTNEENKNECTAIVNLSEYSGGEYIGFRTVTLTLTADKDAEFGWVITEMSETELGKGDEEEQTDEGTEEISAENAGDESETAEPTEEKTEN